MKPNSKLAAILALSLVALTACETMEGLGRDTQKLGGNVTDAAEKNDLDNNQSQ
jgi:predicted small secreted protein